MDSKYELIIIGSGPAGMTAAIYAGRAGLKCAMIEAEAPGGKLIKTAEIANYTGVQPESGADLAYQMYEHSLMFNCESLFNSVSKIEDGEVKKVVCTDGTEYYADAVIVATGTKERLMNIPMEKELTGRGVSYCAVCDGAFYRNKEVAVIGGGNSALEESLYLTEFVDKVHLIVRRDVFRADSIAQEKVRNNPKVGIHFNRVPKEILSNDNKVAGLVISDTKSENTETVNCSGIFPYIGADPCTEMLEGLGVLDEHGYIMVNADMETSVKGIYGAGDVTKKTLRQVVTAVSDGAVAAQNAFKYIRNKNE